MRLPFCAWSGSLRLKSDPPGYLAGHRFKETVVAGTLDTYRLLGRSGLRVSPLALGTMTFGEDWGWGAAEDESRRIFDAFFEAGAATSSTPPTVYTNGTARARSASSSGRSVTAWCSPRKYTLTTRPGTDPNAGRQPPQEHGRLGRGQPARLRTDYIDLLYLHVWDGTTPVEEVMRAIDDLVSAGQGPLRRHLRHGRLAVAMQPLADLRGWSPFDRTADRVQPDRANRGTRPHPDGPRVGLGVIAWSPLAGGVLTGKYTHADLDHDGGSAAAEGTRKNVAAANGSLTERGLAIADVVKDVATETGFTPSQVALAWTMHNPAVTAPIIGARTLGQLEDNLGALEVSFTESQLAALEKISAVELGFPHDFLDRPMTRNVMFGDLQIEA